MTPEPTLEPPARLDGCTDRESEPPPSLSDCGQGGQIALRGAEGSETGLVQVDDFSSSNQLGPNWTTHYSSNGAGELSIATDAQRMAWNGSVGPIQISQHVSLAMPGNGNIAAYGSLPNSAGEQVGAQYTAGDVCPNCRKPFEAGHVVYADLKPAMSGVFQHRDCDDPTLDAEEPDDDAIAHRFGYVHEDEAGGW